MITVDQPAQAVKSLPGGLPEATLARLGALMETALELDLLLAQYLDTPPPQAAICAASCYRLLLPSFTAAEADAFARALLPGARELHARVMAGKLRYTGKPRRRP